MKNILFIATIVGVQLMSGCKKEDKINPPNTVGGNSVTREKLLDKSWKLVAKTVDPAKSPGFFKDKVTDWYAQLEACEKDNVKSYKGDGSMMFDEGATKCKTDDAQSVAGTWLFNSDNSTITEKKGSAEKSMTVVEVSATTLKTTYSESGIDGKYTYIETYTAQ